MIAGNFIGENWIGKYFTAVRLALIVFLTTFLLGFFTGNSANAADDFLIAVDDYSRLYYAKSNGDGTFGSLTYLDYMGGNYSRGVVVNDFDNDGDNDIIAGRGKSSTAYFTLFINDGTNTFTKTAVVGTLTNANSYTMDMATGDFNNDGNQDFLANGNHSTTGLYLGDGSGSFTKIEMNLGAYGRGMDVADFNNDGNLDFARARYSSGVTYIYPGNGDGTFDAAIVVGDTGNDPYGLAAGDFNNDGFADIIVNSGSGGDPYFFAGNGDNTFDAAVYVGSLDVNNHGAYDAFDFDGDGDLDFIIANYTGRRVYYYPGNGDGTFGGAVEIGGTSSNTMGISALPIGPPSGVPEAVLTPSSATIAEAGTVDFDGSTSTDDVSISTYDWAFGDGGTDTAMDPAAYTYANEGTYYPTLKVTDDTSKSDFDSGKIIVQGDTPTVDTSAVAFSEILADYGLWNLTLDQANYSSDGVGEGIVTSEWNLDDGYADDFEDGNDDGWSKYAGTWVIDDTNLIGGAYTYRQNSTSPTRTWNLFNKVFDSDLIIEVDVSLLATSSYKEAQILFRARNEKNNYEFILRGGSYNDILLYRRINGSTTNLFEYDLPSSSPSYPIDSAGSVYHIKIVCTGSLIQFYLDGVFLFAYSDSTFMSGRVGLSTYKTDALFDNLTVTAVASGQTIQHAFTAGTHNVSLAVTDGAGQTAVGVIPMTMPLPGEIPPVADANGPYSVGESAASEGGWTFTLDGTGSTDDVEIREYAWDLGTDTFDGTVFQNGKWYINGGVSQNNEVSLAGTSWGTRYLVTKDLFPKTRGQVFQTKIKTAGSGSIMFGFKNSSSTSFHYSQFPYEFYITGTSVYIYENSFSRGFTGYYISYNTWYDFKIELKDVGAIYYYRPTGTEFWYEIYNSNYSTGDTTLRKGFVANSGTYIIDDFLETTAGMNPNFTLYRGTGLFDVDLTVCDRADQCDTASTTVVITDGDDPVASAGADQALDETDASSGQWSGSFDASGSTDDFGIYSYEWDWDYDGVTFNPSGDTGATATHSWSTLGTHTVAVRVIDHALQSSIGTMNVVISQGDPPTADAGGPYAVDEFAGNVFEGGWTATLDGSGSFDAESSISWFWDMGTDTFTGMTPNSGKWLFPGSGVTQNDELSVTGTSTWGQRYLFSKDNYTRAKGMAFEAKVKHTSYYAMIGFKNPGTNYSYTQMPYAVYFNNSNVYIYEYGANRGDTGYNYSFNTWYDVRIELKETQGARYYYRLSGNPDWILLYDSNNYTDVTFKKGFTIRYGSLIIDDYKEIATGSNPSYRFYGLGSHPVSLTVFDQAMQSDTDSTSVTTSGNDPPVPDAGADQAGNESDAFEGVWTFDFDASGSTDDFSIFTYEWDFDNDGIYDKTGINATHSFDTPGTHTVVLRVTDHALQKVTDTATVTLTTGDPPVAEAGLDLTTEGHWPVIFNGGGSSDDLGIIKYTWDFGDGTTGKGKTPTHIYWTPGDYTVTLTVYDNAMQSDSDTTTVHVLTAANAPAAGAGGPYNAGAGGPPAYFNGSTSTDDYGVVKYLWDVDDTVDSDLDGNFTNDMDVVGRKPFYTYASAGSYTATLTVVDGAGQEATASATVNVAVNLAPDVICVPWRAGNPLSPHETYNGRSIRLKAIVRDAGALTYQWNFGDGSPLEPAAPAPVTNKRVIEASHIFPNSPDGTPYTATLTVWDSDGLTGTDTYYVIVQPDNLDTRTNIAIDEGLWWLHKTQYSGGNWLGYNTSYYASSTASSIQAFEINGHLQNGDHQENPYVETVNKGFAYLFTKIRSYTYAGPWDSNGNGIEIGVNSGRPIYEGGMVMDAIASSNTPLAFATTGGTNVKGRFYYHILTDMVDMYAWGQVDSGSRRGGWRYSWNSDADNSACQWAAIGMLAAEDNFGINVPQFVKDENDTYWLHYSYNGTGFGYTGPGNGVAQTPSGMVQLAFDDKYTNDPRWRTAEDYIATHWFWQNNNYYAAYSMTKAFRLAQPNPVVILQATGLDWYNDLTTGLRKRVVDQQAGPGTYWGSWDSAGYGGRGLDTPWAIIMLTPSLFVQPPVADAGDDIIWAFDQELSFNASGSFHMDPSRTIVKYEWDFDGDGTYDFTTDDPSDPDAKYTYPDPNPGTEGDLPEIYLVRLRVTDDNEPEQTDIDIREVTVAEPPHAPFADPNGPYTATAGIPFTLDGSGSSDIDPGDSLTLYQWDLDDDGVWFDDVDLETGSATAAYTYGTPGVYNIGLKVWDNGAFNPVDCTIGDDCVPMPSEPAFTTVTVVVNVAPIADPNGPYTVDEGTPATLDGTGSTDPNGDTLSYAWDLDDDGDFDDSTDEQPSRTWMDDGVYTVSLRVSDSLLTNEASTTVTVNDLGPTAAFTWSPEPQSEGTAVQFTDASSSSPDTIVGWSWDFGSLGSSADQNPSFTFNDNGIHTVTLTVTDEDGSTDVVSHDVTITDRAPSAALAGDASLDEGQAGGYDASGSTSNPDAIVGYEWDWDYNGTTFNPSGDTGATQSHAWMDDGTYTVAVRITDDDGSTDIATLSVTVGDLGPTSALTGDTSLDEGQAGNYDASGSTSSPDTIAGYEWDWEYDGTTFNPSGDTGATQSHAWMDDGTYTVAVRVTDDDGSTDIATLSVTVANVGPNPDLTGDTTVDEGQAGSYDASGSSASPGTITGYEWDWNYNGTTFNPSGDTGAAESHTYLDDGTYTVAVRVTDDDGSTDIATLEVTVNDLGPTAALTGDTALEEGVTGNYNASGSTSSPDAIVGYEWDWDYDGVTFTPSGDTGATPTHSWPTAGTYTTAVRVTDDDGSTDVATLAVTISAPSQIQTIFNLAARAKLDKIQLTWSPVTGATCYNVYRATVSGGPYTLVADCHVTTYATYLDPGLTMNVKYYYVVTSVAGSESLNSNEASATPRPRVRR